jgi:UDP:flavonoid glycosyltransferase YjiC (YdhE family)
MKLIKLTLTSLLALVGASTTSASAEEPLHIGISITFATRSHIKYIMDITQPLAEKGHKITYLSIDQLSSFGDSYNVTHYSIGKEEIFSGDFGDMKPFTGNDAFDKGFDAMVQKFSNIYRDSFTNYEKFYKDEKPDLMVCDYNASSCIESAIKNHIPFIIGYQSLIFAANAPYITLSGLLEPTTIKDHSFLQRMKHAIVDPMMKVKTNYPFMKAIERHRIANGVPLTWQFPVWNHLGLGIANSYIGFEQPRAISSHIHLVGPVISTKYTPLDASLKEFLDTRERVLYVAFGSMIRIIPELTVDLLQHFQQLVNEKIVDGIIWSGLNHTNFDSLPKSYKVEGVKYLTQDITSEKHAAIKMIKWSPQQAVLNHPSTKLFLSHGGLDSVYEALDAGVPLIILPFFGDQPRNAMLIKEHNAGDYIEWPAMTSSLIQSKFKTLLNPENIKLQSKLSQLKLITKFSSQRVQLSSELIESYAQSAKACRPFDTAEPFKDTPCELKPFLPLDYRISPILANLWDVYIVFGLFLISVISLLGWGVFKIGRRCLFGKKKSTKDIKKKSE